MKLERHRETRDAGDGAEDAQAAGPVRGEPDGEADEAQPQQEVERRVEQQTEPEQANAGRLIDMERSHRPHGAGRVEQRTEAEQAGAEEGPGCASGEGETEAKGGEGDEPDGEGPGADGGGGGVGKGLRQPRRYVTGAIRVGDRPQRGGPAIPGDQVSLKFLGIFVSVGGYALIWGWRFAVGFVILILKRSCFSLLK